MKFGPIHPTGGQLQLRPGRHHRELRAAERPQGAGAYPGLAPAEPGLALPRRRRRRPHADAGEQGAGAAAAGVAHPDRGAALRRRGHVLGRRERGHRPQPGGRTAPDPVARADGDRLHRPRLPGGARGGGTGGQALHQRLQHHRGGQAAGAARPGAGPDRPRRSRRLRRPPDAHQRRESLGGGHPHDHRDLRRPGPGQPDHRDGHQRLHRLHVALPRRSRGDPGEAGLPLPRHLPRVPPALGEHQLGDASGAWPTTTRG